MAKKDTETKSPNTTKENSITPLMQQYKDIKNQYRGMILFFRLGDFYEMFGEDAQKACKIMEVVLTQRNGVPMCGIPYHAVNSYLRKLIKAGEKVAVCEQLEEPGAGKGIVKRGVVRVITPGTILEENLLNSKQNNYLACVYPSQDFSKFALAYVDISTGEFACTETTWDKLSNEIFRISPGEMVIPQNYLNNQRLKNLSERLAATVSPEEDYFFSPFEAESKIKQTFKVQSLKPLGIENRLLAASAAGGIIAYLEKTQINSFPPLSKIRYYSLEDYLLLDDIAIENLELIEGLNSRTTENSLLQIIDLTLTPMGGRLLNGWLTHPLLSVQEIKKRQEAAGFFVEDGICRRKTREHLKNISDIERILSRISSQAAGPREVLSLKNSLLQISQIKENLEYQSTEKDANNPPVSPVATVVADSSAILDNIFTDGLPINGQLQTPLKCGKRVVATQSLWRGGIKGDLIFDISKKMVIPDEVIDVIAGSLVDEPPVNLKDGGVIRTGFNAELDELRRIRREVKTLISDMETNEREQTGISSLKIGYTSVFGYYIEVTKSNLASVPQNYVRKQTVANGERFITPELKSFEEKILSAEEKLLRLEEQIFREICDRILAFSGALQEISKTISEIDIYAAFAEASILYNYIRPEINDSFEIDIKDGRHPVIERKMKSGSFVSNDTYLNAEKDQIILLTGPNMAGKSTYLRQTALIVIMSQIGCYVPASEAKLGIVDRIFTRIGAGDNLSGGESTFMVEMHETANILNQNTQRSLIILDEVGRGTSTYDGISIAWATVEYLSDIKRRKGAGPKVLFATHYFELTDLEGKLPGVKNYNVSVKEWQGEVVFLHKIVKGAADRSYGIHVARLAGLPEEVIKRAYSILIDLEKEPTASANGKDAAQLELLTAKTNLLTPSPSLNFLIELEKLDPDSITPIEALQLVAKWKLKLKNMN